MKMILAVLLVITFVCTMFSASAIVPGEDTAANEQMDFAISEGLILDNELSINERLEIISNSMSLSEEQKLQAFDKINSINKTTDENLAQTNSTIYNFTAAIPYFRQNTTYFCGPATTQQSIHYILGMSHYQEEIAEALGTTTAGTDGMRIVAYMNSNQNDVYYIDVTPTDEADMASRIYRGLSYYGSAPILRLEMYQSQGWQYYSGGHFMNASGIYSAAYSTTGVLQYEVTDPYIQYINPSETDGKYRINSIAVYNSTMNHFAQEFYY